MTLSIHTIFREKKPLLTALHNDVKDQTKLIHLYHPGSGLTIHEVQKNKRLIKSFVEKHLARGGSIITSDFKNHIQAFDLDFASTVDVYDTALPDKLHKAGSDLQASEEMAKKVAIHLSGRKLQTWQKLFANAGIVYDDLESRGVLVGGQHLYPQWSQKVFSGRSKTTGFNIQNVMQDYDIRLPQISPLERFIHFDWKAADIRVAALLSNDAKLLDMSYHDDPYVAISKELGIVKRADAKQALLRSINSMSIDADAVRMFPDLRDWIRDCRRELSQSGKLPSILDRLFDKKVAKDQYKRKNPPRATFNATMQGSVAHAMHSSIKRVWDRVGHRLVCEIHDCIIISCPRDRKHAGAIIRDVVDIVRNPFCGLISSNPVFPVRVSVGDSWRQWKELRIFS